MKMPEYEILYTSKDYKMDEMEESEAEKLMEKYQQTSEEDSYPNAVDAFDLFDEDEDKSSDSEINKYKALNLSAFRKDNE